MKTQEHSRLLRSSQSRFEKTMDRHKVEAAEAMGIELLTEAQYRALQQLGESDGMTSSWIATPRDIRSLGGARCRDRRYGHVFVFHNGAHRMGGTLASGMRMRVPRALCAALVASLQACVVVPRTTEVYDERCRVASKQMDLEAVQIAAIQGCSNSGCGVLLAAAGAPAVASTVISGSIVVVGNVVYWLEKQGRCQPEG